MDPIQKANGRQELPFTIQKIGIKTPSINLLLQKMICKRLRSAANYPLHPKSGNYLSLLRFRRRCGLHRISSRQYHYQSYGIWQYLPDSFQPKSRDRQLSLRRGDNDYIDCSCSLAISSLPSCQADVSKSPKGTITAKCIAKNCQTCKLHAKKLPKSPALQIKPLSI